MESESTGETPTIELDRTEVPVGEALEITVTCGDESVEFPNSSPHLIYKRGEGGFWDRIGVSATTAMVMELQPGESLRWTWDATAELGEYKVVVSGLAQEWVLEHEFEIVEN